MGFNRDTKPSAPGKIETDLLATISEINKSLQKIKTKTGATSIEQMGMLDFIRKKSLDDLQNDLFKNMQGQIDTFVKLFDDYRADKSNISDDSQHKISAEIKKLSDETSSATQAITQSKYLINSCYALPID